MTRLYLIAFILSLFVGQDVYADRPDSCQAVLDSFRSLNNCSKAIFIKDHFGSVKAREENGWCFTDIISEVEETTHIEAGCLKGTAGYVKYAHDSLFLIDFAKWKKALCKRKHSSTKSRNKRTLQQNNKVIKEK